MSTLMGAPVRRIEVDRGKVRTLSFTSSLGLIALLAEIPKEGLQAIVATHSPLIAATPGATVIEVGEWGMRRVAFQDLELVQSWRDFLASPERYVKYLAPS